MDFFFARVGKQEFEGIQLNLALLGKWRWRYEVEIKGLGLATSFEGDHGEEVGGKGGKESK